jgi:predicted HNH restriction endonuclease
MPQLNYSETKSWAAFKAGPSRAIAYLGPAKRSIRVFLPLDPNGEPDLKSSPSTGTWARFQSVFKITSENDLARASQLILSAAASLDQKPELAGIKRSDQLSPDEIEDGSAYIEGAVRQVTVNAYERNQKAREECLRRFGRNCVICGFNFLATYGAEAADYIQVHHIKPIARAGGSYVLNPIRDLRPVCPNCHAVIHRREPPFAIAEVRRMLRRTAARR